MLTSTKLSDYCLDWRPVAGLLSVLCRYLSRPLMPTQLGHSVNGAISTADRFDHRWGRNGEFRVALDLVCQDCCHTGLLCAGLTGNNRCRLKVKGDEIPRDGPHGLGLNLACLFLLLR